MFIRAFFLVFLKKYNYTPWENSLSFNLALIANSEPANTDIRFAPGFMLRIAIISRRSILLAYFPGVYPSSEKEKENYLRWHHQIVCVYTTKLTRAIGALKRVRQFVPPSTHLTMYNSFIQPYFDYFLVLQCCLGGSGVWTTSEASKTTKPRSWQHSLFYSYDSSSGPLLQELGWAIRFGYRGAGIWNKLPEDLRESKSMNLFKSKMYLSLPSIFDSLI